MNVDSTVVFIHKEYIKLIINESTDLYYVTTSSIIQYKEIKVFQRVFTKY